MSVPCSYPEDMFEDGGSPPEPFEEWKTTETCDHAYCAEADDAFRIYRGSRGLSRDDQAALEGDRELMLDEFHVR